MIESLLSFHDTELTFIENTLSYNEQNDAIVHYSLSYF